MRFYADLHIHSKHSRATSRDADLEHLAYWAARKGIAVIATGDFTHPVWLAELKDKLVPAEPGLFRLRPEIEQEVTRMLPGVCQAVTRFMLSVEISTIYKRDGFTRKIHHLLYAPNFDAADRIAAQLGRIGNISSDGRPILGLDSRHLLEITLESHPGSYLIPAHIWTPWFAVLGSKSGFDSIVDCYGDLSEHIFAVETGLSSDPPMNWRLSFLDRYRLVSNSDAHSPPKLGREATLFDCDLDYFAIRRALETGEGYVGTVEFFAEEGKYHHDGHRACGVRLTPRETIEHGGRCPQCGQAVTVGVLHRIETLADRSEADTVAPATAGAVTSLVPLPEIISEIVKSGPTSKTVERRYDRLIATLGSELSILTEVPVEDIARADSTLMAEAVTRLRAGQVIRDAGYDGEYGVIHLFEDTELQQQTAGGLLFDVPAPKKRKAPPPGPLALPPHEQTVAKEPLQRRMATAPVAAQSPSTAAIGLLEALDEDQRTAAATIAGPLLIVAGPGSGKTRTLTHRMAHLIAEYGIPTSGCLAITFTRRAAAEMRERLSVLLPALASDIPIHTFHSLGLAILKEQVDAAGLPRNFSVATEAERAAVLAEGLNISEQKTWSLLRAISKSKRTGQPINDEIETVLPVYQRALKSRHWIDFDDLVGLTVQLLADNPGVAEHYRERFRSISADEFQDVDEQQYRLLATLAPSGANLCLIGDPNQAIYGFRGADASCFDRFLQDYPDTTIIRLARNYRSSGTIVLASSQVIAAADETQPAAEAMRDLLDRVTIHAASTEQAEAEYVVHTIEEMIGGHSFFSIDSGRANTASTANFSFADFAVLYRTDAQSTALCEALARSGMPFQKHGQAPLAEQPGVQALLKELDQEPEDGVESLPLAAALKSAAERLSHKDSSLDASVIQEALHQLTIFAIAGGYSHAGFAEAVALATDADTRDPRADRISLLTIHAAKGLEFPVVFVVGLEDGLLPLHWGDGTLDAAAMAEERRLFYVGMTRAKDRLILSRAKQRHQRGRVRTLEPSPFLHDIENALLQHERARTGEWRPVDKQLTLL